MSTSGTNPLQGLEVTPAQLTAHTEQAMLNLVYVQTGNDILGSALTNLDNALNTTQSVLNILQALQNLHNDIKVQSKSAFNFNYKMGGLSGSNLCTGYTVRLTLHSGKQALTAYITQHFSTNLSAYQAAYNKAASAYFGKAIDPVFAFASSTASGYSNFLNTLRTLKDKLRLEISALTKQTPLAAQNDPGSLLGTLRKVYNDLPTSMDFNSVEKWAVDNYNAHGSTAASLGGALQNDLTFAITAAQSLNDTQKEQVRRYLFIFQQYYQSAAAVITQINQIITQMAQKISQ